MGQAEVSSHYRYMEIITSHIKLPIPYITVVENFSKLMTTLINLNSVKMVAHRNLGQNTDIVGYATAKNFAPSSWGSNSSVAHI